MIRPNEKVSITEVLDHFGPEKVLKALSRNPVKSSWQTCFLACVYGEYGELEQSQSCLTAALDDDHARATLLNMDIRYLGVVVGTFDNNTVEFLELVDEWLELNVVKVESLAAVGV